MSSPALLAQDSPNPSQFAASGAHGDPLLWGAWGGANWADSTGQEPREPYQTELPFLWMLAVKGYLMVKDQDEEHYADKDPLTWEQLCLYGARLETYGSAARNRGRRFFGRR